MKCKNNDMARHVRVRAVVAYPAASIAVVACAANPMIADGVVT